MPKIIDGGKLEFSKPGEPSVESRYDYYRRCRAQKSSGEQCKAPAMKEHDICRKHAEQRESAERAEGQRRDFAARASANQAGKDVSGINGDAMSVQRTIRDLMQAMIDGELDEDVEGAMLDEIAVRQGLMTRF